MHNELTTINHFCKWVKEEGLHNTEKFLYPTILDISANVGFFGLIARKTFPSAVIHAYEPNPNLEQYLSVQAAVSDVRYFMEVVGRKNGTIQLDLNEDSVQTRLKQSTEGNIPQVAFSEATKRLSGKVDLLKMDCEGGKWEIFNDKESWKNVKNLSMGYHFFESGHTEQAVKDIIINLGFRITSFLYVVNALSHKVCNHASLKALVL